MRAVVQRVSHCRVTADGQDRGTIGQGLMILLGVEDADAQEDVTWLAKKLASMRIFDDGQGVMNLSITDVDGEAYVVSQFTLHASTRKGNRPSYIKAARPDKAIPLYESFIAALQGYLRRPILTGKFGANMALDLINDGPVTIIIDSKDRE